ncbi:WD repeat-containing protein [Reticulomyxa filosa]|uniref:WD repeat-containing protein n=1 Tax=Reticulomyxa filosa TaxID=46433 RepID=X6L8G6_RETFI|nr:WD repeat-containing protein [Reticulomyxa filosa]|eukprot:ETN97728.1 WD repeat-containing protein [Reticulomyxa filosa]
MDIPICSGSCNKTIHMWDIETTKQLNIFKGHQDWVMSVKYGSNELGNIGGANTILSGSCDKSIHLWDIRSGQQIQVFNGHTNEVWAVEYSPFVVNNIEVGGSSNNELYVIKEETYKSCGILYFIFIKLKKKKRETKNANNDLNLCYGSVKGPIFIWR